MTRRSTRLQIDIIATLPALRTLARCYTPDLDYAEQLVVDTLIEALGNAGTFHPEEDPYCWLLGHLRRLAATTAVVEPAKAEPQPDAVEADLRRLPVEVREVLVMHEGLHMTPQQIARVCGYSIGRAVENLTRGRVLMNGGGADDPPRRG